MAGWICFLVGYGMDSNVFGAITKAEIGTMEGLEDIGNNLLNNLVDLGDPDKFCFIAFAVLGGLACILHMFHQCCSLRIFGMIIMILSCLAIGMAGAVANPTGVAFYKCGRDANVTDADTLGVINSLKSCLGDEGIPMTLQFVGSLCYLLFHTIVVAFVFWNAGTIYKTKTRTKVVPLQQSEV